MDLRDLHRELAAAVLDGRPHKVHFYFSADDSVGVRPGHVMVHGPEVCEVFFGELKGARALHVLPQLRLLKVHTMILTSTPPPGQEALRPNDVLAHLAEAMRNPAPVVPAPAATAAACVMSAPAQAKVVQNAPAQIGLQHLQLQQDATRLLAVYYGAGAAAKVTPIAHRYPPSVRPQQFLKECEQLAAILVGAQKAQSDFAPLRARFQNE